MAPIIKTQIARLKRPAKEKSDAHADAGDGDDDDEPSDSAAANNKDHALVARLDKLEHMMQEVNDRLKSIEGRRAAGEAVRPVREIIRRSSGYGSAIRIRKSRKLLPVGPVTSASPKF